MSKKSILLVFLMALLFVSCGNKSQENADASAAADTTAVKEDLQQEEINQMEEVINGVSACLDSIQMQEHMIFNAKEGTTNKQKVLEQLRSFKDLLARKQAQINALMAQNKNMSSSSKKTIQNLQKMVDYLNEQLKAKDEQISNLQKQVNLGKVHLEHLAFDYAVLDGEKSYLEEQNSAQDAELNTAYYIVASKSELKNSGLLKSNLFSKKVNNENIDASLFQKIDIRKVTKIEINSKSPKILSNNPASSYTLTKNDDKTTTLTITDTKKFWNVSKYLIIQE